MSLKRWTAAAGAAALVVGLAVPTLAATRGSAGKGKDHKPKAMHAAAQQAPFTDVTAFATKTGTRGVVAWQTDAPIQAYVTWETDGAEPQGFQVKDAPDTAGVAIIDSLEVGKTYTVTVSNALDLTQVSAPVELVARNAYTDYGANTSPADPADVSRRDNVYTIDMLVQLDTQSLPKDVPHDQSLEDAADAFNIVAERMYDALDGHARLGNVLVTDTQFAYAVNEPFGVEEATTATNEINPCGADRNLADVLIQSAPPFDSHTFSYAIEEPCASFYVGRLGWLIANPWVNDLDMGYTSTHELLHYAFGAPDLYGTSDVTGSGGGCKNLAWDGSLMHNSGGWTGSRWQLTEVDRNPQLTPCEHGTEPYTWDQIQSRYTQVPDETELLDVVNYKPRGNPDGGALDIKILDRTPASSTLSAFTPNDENPELNADCVDRTDLTRSSADDAEGDATLVATADTGVTGSNAANEPSLDILNTSIRFVDDGSAAVTEADVLETIITASDLSSTPRASTHISHELRFNVGSTEYVATATKDVATGDEAFSIDGVAIEGAFDVPSNTITMRIPAVLVDGETPVYALEAGDLFVPTATWTRREIGLAPVADQASGGCEITVPGSTGGAEPTGPDATLTEGESYEWSGGPFVDIGDAGGPCDALEACDTQNLLLQPPPEGSALTVSIDVDDQTLSYELTISDGGGIVHTSTESADAEIVVPVPTSDTYSVTINPWWTAGGSYTATARLGVVPPPVVPPADAVLTDGGDAYETTVTSPASNLEHSCTGPNDPLCVTKVVDLRPAGEVGTLSLELSAEVPLEDWDVYVYDVYGRQLGSVGNPATVIESGQVELPAGVYYIVLQPYIAVEGSVVTLTASLV